MTTPANCSCTERVCPTTVSLLSSTQLVSSTTAMPPTTMPSSTAMLRTTIGVTSISTTSSSTHQTVTMPTLSKTVAVTSLSTSAIESEQQISSTRTISASVTQAETSTPTNGTAGVATASTSAHLSEVNAALIGGIVGGIVALILVGGLIVFLVARSRRRRGNGEPNGDAALQSVGGQSAPTNGVHDAGVALQRKTSESLSSSRPDSNYGVIPSQQYDAWTKLDNFATPSPQGTDYEDFTKIH
jgi:hypothetical protein